MPMSSTSDFIKKVYDLLDVYGQRCTSIELMGALQMVSIDIWQQAQPPLEEDNEGESWKGA